MDHSLHKPDTRFLFPRPTISDAATETGRIPSSQVANSNVPQVGGARLVIDLDKVFTVQQLHLMTGDLCSQGFGDCVVQSDDGKPTTSIVLDLVDNSFEILPSLEG